VIVGALLGEHAYLLDAERSLIFDRASIAACIALCATEPTGQRFMKASLTRLSGRRGFRPLAQHGDRVVFMFIFWMKPHFPSNGLTALDAGLREEAGLERIPDASRLETLHMKGRRAG